jgi:hypothetical protein
MEHTWLLERERVMDEENRGGRFFSLHVFEERVYVTDINEGKRFFLAYTN